MSTARTFAQKIAKSRRDARYRAKHYAEIMRKQRERRGNSPRTVDAQLTPTNPCQLNQ